jgi:hypothetical protein
MFIPDIPKPVLILHGEQGSAKSTLLELIKMLVDPSSIRTLSFPRDKNELVQQLSHNYITYFDNISNIKEWVSDELCLAVTGSGSSKRMLFTDDDDVIYNFRRCIGFSGINVAATKADLLDRGLTIELTNIPDDKKRLLIDIWNEFDRIRGPLLGYIFDILVRVLQIKKQSSIKLDKHPRMADFTEIAEIISRSMGYSDNQFIEVYYKNKGLQTQQALEVNPLACTMIKFISQVDKNYWIGTATHLLNELDTIADQDLKIKISKLSSWPKSPGSLSRKIPEVKTLLREAGIVIERPVDTGTNTKLVEIRKISPEDKNQAQKEHDNSGDIVCENGLSSEISPEINRENQAQKQQSGDTGDTGDILHMYTGTPVTGLGIPIKEPYNDNGTKGKQEEERPIVCESSTSNNEYGNNQSCYGKPTTATISALTTNTTNSTATAATNIAVYRLGGTDTWACRNCKIKADKWFMQIHDCSRKK